MTVRRHRSERRPRRALVRRRRGDDGQQAILLVVGIAIMIFLFSTVLVAASSQQLPLVSNTLIDHAAYRALQAGVSEYLYGINEDPNAVACVHSGAASCSYFTQHGLKFQTWVPVANTAPPSSGPDFTPSEWFSIGYPTLDPTTETIELAVVGAAGFTSNASSIHYQTANITFSAKNNFLLNVTFSNYNTLDPAITGVQATTCSYLWQGGDPCAGPGGNAYVGYIDPSFPVFGPMYSNDEILVCQNPTLGPITTPAPGSKGTIHIVGGTSITSSNIPTYVAPGCSSGNAITQTAADQARNVVSLPKPEPLPKTDTQLASLARADGCYYIGPTTLTFLPGGGYYVDSPDTPWLASSGAHTTYDGLSFANDKSQCFPSTSGATSGDVASMPDNGVIYVASVPNTAITTTGGSTSTTCTSGLPTNPLYNAYNAYNNIYTGQNFTFDGEGSSKQAVDCEGDAIVHGTVDGAVTVASANDIMIDGNLVYSSNTYTDAAGTTVTNCQSLLATDPATGNTYQQTMNTSASGGTPGAWPVSCTVNGVGANTSTAANDVIGLIANEFVSVNNPLSCGYFTCNPLPACPTTTTYEAPTCSMQNPIVMGSILALNHAFSVPNYEFAPQMGEIDFYGSLSEQFVDIESQSAGGSYYNGYGMDYNWDPRLGVLSPPHYLTPGTPSWAVQSFSVTVGKCSTVWPVQSGTAPCDATP